MWEKNGGEAVVTSSEEGQTEREEERRCEISHLSTAVLFPKVL